MPIRTVILDFDGTCTDLAVESRGFFAAYKELLAQRAGEAEFAAAWKRAEKMVREQPSRFGWTVDGNVVAPPSDPYLFATTVGALAVPSLSSAENDELFRRSYERSSTAFRVSTAKALRILLGSMLHTFIVTNSSTETVTKKLELLGLDRTRKMSVLGGARKYQICEPHTHSSSEVFRALPLHYEVHGWDRPLLVRRGRYFDVLQDIWLQTGTAPEETLVVGDVLELDLLLPALIGCKIALLECGSTLPYEIEGTLSLDGRVLRDLLDLETACS